MFGDSITTCDEPMRADFAKRGGSQEYPNCGACKESVEHVLFECASYDSQKQNFFDYMKQFLAMEAF